MTITNTSPEALIDAALEEIAALRLDAKTLARIASGIEGLSRFIDGADYEVGKVPRAMRAPLTRAQWLAQTADVRRAFVCLFLAHEYAEAPADNKEDNLA